MSFVFPSSLALVVRGPLRLSVAEHSRLIRVALRQFTSAIPRVDIYLCTYQSRQTLELISSISDLNFHAYVALAEPSELLIAQNLRSADPGGYIDSNPWTHSNRINAFKQYWTAKAAIALPTSLGDYQYIFHTRSDVELIIESGDLPSWFTGSYAAPHVRHGGDSFTNDQVSCAPSSIMKAAWDYGDVDRLYNALIFSKKGEDVLDSIVAERKILLSTSRMRFGAHIIRP